MIESPVIVQTSVDAFRGGLVSAFRRSNDGERALEFVRMIVSASIKERGRRGNITLNGGMTDEDRTHFGELPDGIRGEILDLAKTGKPINRASFEHLIGCFEQSRAVARCIIGAYVEAHRVQG